MGPTYFQLELAIPKLGRLFEDLKLLIVGGIVAFGGGWVLDVISKLAQVTNDPLKCLCV